MAITCGELTRGIIAVDCNSPLVSGLRTTAYIMNTDDIDRSTTVITNGVITDFQLKAGKSAYKVQVAEDGIMGMQTFVRATYSTGWTHQISLKLLDISKEVKDFITELQYGRVTIIVANKYIKEGLTPGDTVYEVYGYSLGLQLTEGTRDTSNADVDGGYEITLSTKEGEKEKLILSVFKTDLTTTETMLDALVA